MVVMNLHAPSRTVLVEVVARPVAAPAPTPAGPVAAPRTAPRRAHRTRPTASTHRPHARRP
jgi:hypothetical protein